MSGMVISPRPIAAGELGAALAEPGAGACVRFEGRVGNRHERREVWRRKYLDYTHITR